jgi:hypothetical protein
MKRRNYSSYAKAQLAHYRVLAKWGLGASRLITTDTECVLEVNVNLINLKRRV